MNRDELAKGARLTYALAKGCSERQILDWDAPPDGNGLPEQHKQAWAQVVDVVAGTQEAEEDVAARAWSTYAEGIGAVAFAMPWERSSADHRSAWGEVVRHVRAVAGPS